MTLTEILDQLGIDYKLPGQHHHVTRGWIGVDCPWCKVQGHFRLGLHEQKRIASCWTCGIHPMTPALAMLSRIPRGECETLLRHIPRRRVPAMLIHKVGTYRPPPTAEITPESRVGRYLTDHRGFDLLKLKRLWGIKAIQGMDDRVFIPIHENGVAVSYTHRLLDGEFRYLNAPEDRESVSAKSLLYGEDHCRSSVIVVEGPTDAWRIGPGAVALMGLKLTTAQLNRICRYTRRVICLDNEPQAVAVARKLCKSVECFPGETHLVRLESGNDPGDADEEEIQDLRRRFLE